ncbi:MAG TPA: hypothetical protein VF142_07270 [Longimicrobium sp.]
MPADHVLRARQMDWHALRMLWRQIEAGDAAGWPPGRALEHLVLRGFELSGADVRWPYTVPIAGEVVEQIDGAVHLHGLSCIVECKDTSVPLNVDAIAKQRNQLLSRPASAIGLLFSRGGFTLPATMLGRFVAPQTILLWDGNDIAYHLEREDFAEGLVQRYRLSIENGMMKYEIPREVSR